MCKFHKDVAIAVATDPVNGKIDPLRYSITLCALAKFWIDKYMPEMGYLDGYSKYELSTSTARKAFLQSGIEQEVRTSHIAFLRESVDKIISEHKLTAHQLNLPKKPDMSPRFLDMVMLGMYEGDPTQELTIKATVDNPKHRPLRDAVAAIYCIEGYATAIEESLKTSISNIFTEARQNTTPQLLSIYERFPKGLRTAFGSCSLHGGGGALAHIIVCGGMNVAIGGFSGAFMNAAMYAVAPVVAVGSTFAVERYRLNDFNAYKYLLPVGISLMAAFGLSKALPHEHSADPKLGVFYSLSPQQRYDELQKQYIRFMNLPDNLRHKVELEATHQNMTTAMFMVSLDSCGGDLTPQILAYESQRNAEILKQQLK